MAIESILFIYRYIYVIYIKYIEIIIYIYYTLSYNIYIYSHAFGLEKIYGDFINGTVLLEKCFNFHILIRWHLISQLVGEEVKVVVSAGLRAPTLVILLRARLFRRDQPQDSEKGLLPRGCMLGAGDSRADAVLGQVRPACGEAENGDSAPAILNCRLFCAT